LGDPLKGNLLLFYKPLHLEAQQVSTGIEVRRHQQPHRKLGAKYLFMLCPGFTLLLVQSKALDEEPYKLSVAVPKLAGITF
jgi:hypothetical protein